MDQYADWEAAYLSSNGSAPLEFAKEVMLALKAAPREEITEWYNFNKLGYYETYGLTK